MTTAVPRGAGIPLVGATVVLLEDDPGDALLVREMLLEIEPHLVIHEHRRLSDALAAWPRGASCVLLDLGLPDVSGLAGLRSLQESVPDVPIVVLTGRIDESSGVEALAAGAQDYLVKGEVDARGLGRSVRYAVERKRAQTWQQRLTASELRGQENSRLERGLLPSPLLATDRLRVAATYRPGRQRALLGGDFYDVVEDGAGHVRIVVGDVSGHGPDEAALGVALRIAWRSLVMAGLEEQDVLAALERVLLVERGDDEDFATTVSLVLEPGRTRAALRLAGHPPPLHVDGSGQVRELPGDAVGPPLGLVPGSVLEPVDVELGDSWLLLLFTDGLIEGASTPPVPGQRVERLGSDGLRAQLARELAAGTPPSRLGDRLIAHAEQLQGGPLTDDVAVLVVGTADRWGG